ncbi:class I SAM-dependent methyltransferase [Flavivirga algicola]|uniref:Class I SAM-dependent methyltransferase n=1 Tax=Flavivirga algicola TaxID=2729136 RepID=A0ABX1RTE2_9FLAO|nr:class I SAM-dependent methyltransferase [Flavivirga algicola]NMH86348.1 hypothetical protein [Flavivirga algicola]
MIFKLKKVLNAINEIDKIHRSNDDAYALQIIHKLFPEFCYLPFTPFSLNPYTIIHILNDILFNDRRQIVEFGGGISTIIISRFIKVNNLKTKILSIDNNESWQKIIFNEVKKYDCSDNLLQIHCSIVEHENEILKVYDNDCWYDHKKVNSEIDKLDYEVDLVIVDGPSTATSKFVRYPALPTIQSKLSTSASIFLDDIKRPAEKEILEKWNDMVKGKLTFEKMYGTITLGDSFSTKPLSH